MFFIFYVYFNPLPGKCDVEDFPKHVPIFIVFTWKGFEKRNKPAKPCRPYKV